MDPLPEIRADNTQVWAIDNRALAPRPFAGHALVCTWPLHKMGSVPAQRSCVDLVPQHGSDRLRVPAGALLPFSLARWWNAISIKSLRDRLE